MKSLKTILSKKSGRSQGSMTVRHQGGRSKRYLREIDFTRSKRGVVGIVEAVEYDPNRNAEIAMILYEDGERSYILAPIGLKMGAKIVSSDTAPIEVGNTLPLGIIPVGTQIHNIEIRAGMGGQMVKSAGSFATLQGKEENGVLVRLPSGEIRRFDPKAYATVGQIGRENIKNERVGSAGRNRRKGIRPTVRGVAMHPHAHPHGGGEGRSHVGMKYPKTVYGRKAVGKTRSKKKYSDKTIVSGRKGNGKIE